MSGVLKMSQELRKVYDALDDEIGWIHAKWQIFRQVYGKDKQRVDLLNEFAPVFFRICQDALLDDVLLSLSRLLDRPDMGGRKNLSLEFLVEMVDCEEHGSLCADLKRYLAEVKERCHPIRRMDRSDCRQCPWR